jgi:hypothetical protein
MVRRLGHELQDVGVIALHCGRYSYTRRDVPAQVRGSIYREAAPIRVAKLVDYSYGLGLADSGPFFEAKAAKKTRLSPHLA